MPGETDQARQWGIRFLTPAPPPAADGLGAAGDSIPTREQFSPFVAEHMTRAAEIAAEFSAAAALDDTLAAVQQLADRLEPDEPEGLVRHALMMFITHDRTGRALAIPSLEARKPDSVHPSKSVQELAAATDREALLDWWREDPKANEHHEHWHVVYPSRGVSRGLGQPPTLNDRHGELFYYMHRQMLARYNAERLAVREPASTIEEAKVAPIDDYRAPLPGGYNPGFPLNRRHGPRPDDGVITDFPLGNGNVLPVAFQEQSRDRLLEAARTGRFVDGTPITADLLGATAEQSLGSIDTDFYGGHHNLGHMFISALGQGNGVMAATESAIRDPIFYRWHRHVDDIWFEWQQTLSPQDFGDAPQVVAHPPIAVFESAVPDTANADVWATDQFGGPRFGAANIDDAPATGELTTAMFTRIIPSSASDHGMVIAYLDQRPFGYVLQVENSGAPIEVTARVFLAPADDAEDRRAWIEMDKFKLAVSAGQNTVYRSGSLSSVIKKPAHKPPEVEHDPQSATEADENYCSCGWPYNLLLPRGTRDGMAFRLAVLYTDAALDEVGGDSECGSVSFCGVFDDKYPDARPMGYPFDRPMPGPIVDTLDGLANAASREITIRWIDPWGADASVAVGG